MAERNKLASIPGQPLPERKSNFLSDLWDEASGAFARYGRRSGAQRDASLALLNQASAPGTDPIMGAGQKLLGLAGLITHPLAFFPTREEWDQRLQAAGNDSRIGRSIGGFLSDLPSLIDPQMAAGGAVLATAPLAAKVLNKADDVARASPVNSVEQEYAALFGDFANPSSAHIARPHAPTRAAQPQNATPSVAAEDAGITGWHGSPHEFDAFEFSDRTRGTGEGAQSYGDGLYIGGAEGTGRFYKEKYGDVWAKVAGARVNNEYTRDAVIDILSYKMVPKTQQEAQFNISKTEALNNLRALHERRKSMLKGGESEDVKKNYVDKIEEAIKEVEGLKMGSLESGKGFLYKVKIEGTPEDFPTFHVATKRTPGDEHTTEEARAFAEKAKSAGKKGIKFLDGNSRDGYGGTYNYVVFDAKLITILKKYGIPMTAGAGGAMMVAGQDMPPELASQMGGT